MCSFPTKPALPQLLSHVFSFPLTLEFRTSEYLMAKWQSYPQLLLNHLSPSGLLLLTFSASPLDCVSKCTPLHPFEKLHLSFGALWGRIFSGWIFRWEISTGEGFNMYTPHTLRGKLHLTFFLALWWGISGEDFFAVDFLVRDFDKERFGTRDFWGRFWQWRTQGGGVRRRVILRGVFFPN